MGVQTENERRGGLRPINWRSTSNSGTKFCFAATFLRSRNQGPIRGQGGAAHPGLPPAGGVSVGRKCGTPARPFTHPSEIQLQSSLKEHFWVCSSYWRGTNPTLALLGLPHILICQHRKLRVLGKIVRFINANFSWVLDSERFKGYIHKNLHF